MTYTYPFPAKLPLSSSQLPTTLLSLEDWALVEVSGSDTYQYLQGQLTNDINKIANDQQLLAGHCDAKGRLWGVLQLFTQGDNLAYLIRKSACQQQLTALKKFAVFSKVEIKQNTQKHLLALVGQDARTILQTIYQQLPCQQNPILNIDDCTLLHFSQPTERFIIIANEQLSAQLVNKLADKVDFNNSQQWLALDIEAGHPILDDESLEQHLPQAVNLQALNAISFNKGCYTGQEMVARAKFRGANKRALYWLSGQAQRQPNIGEPIEMQLGENWRKTGSVLSSVVLAEGTLWLQVVLNNDLANETIFRIPTDNNSRLSIQTLPYLLTEE